MEDQQAGIKIGTYWLDENIDIRFDVKQLPVGTRSSSRGQAMARAT